MKQLSVFISTIEILTAIYNKKVLKLSRLLRQDQDQDFIFVLKASRDKDLGLISSEKS